MDTIELSVTEKLEEEKDHSAFLEELLRVLYGEGWDNLTIFDAQKWHKKHIATQPVVQSDADGEITGVCKCGEELYVETVDGEEFIACR